MWSRGRLDITIRDFAAAFAYVILPGNRSRVVNQLANFSAAQNTAVPCLSVRSAMDTLLSILNYGSTDEILFSAINVPAMQQIAEAHNLVAVGIQVERASAFPSIEECRRRITKRTRAMVLAPLFGARVDLAPFRALADEFNLLLIEDAAQAFDGEYRGSPYADVSLFSFGPIKRSTALGGAIAVFQSNKLARAFRSACGSLPMQSRANFIRRSIKLLMLHLLSGPVMYALLFRLMARLGRNPDLVVANSAKGFPAAQLLQKIRQQPCTPMLKLLNRRLQKTDAEGYARHSARFRKAIKTHLSNGILTYGSSHPVHRFWLCPVIVSQPQEVASQLRSQGFDATTLHRMAVISNDTTSSTQQEFQQVLFLPCYPELSEATIRDMMLALIQITQTLGEKRAKHGPVNPSETKSTPAQK